MDNEIKRILDDHEKRISALEDSSSKRGKQKHVEEYKGLAGGIRFLIDNNYFNNPKSVNDINVELKREGYFSPPSSISKLLSVNFTKIYKTLTRVKVDNVWKYVLRK